MREPARRALTRLLREFLTCVCYGWCACLSAAPNNTDSKTNFINTIHMTQVVQAVCMKFEAEHYRRLRSQGTTNTSGYTMGTLYWQANDIWQGASWSSQDYTGRWCVRAVCGGAVKPRATAHPSCLPWYAATRTAHRRKVLHYYAKQFYAPVAVSGYLEAGTMYVWAVNDNQTAVMGSLVFDLINWQTGPVATWTVPATAALAASTEVRGDAGRVGWPRVTRRMTMLLCGPVCTTVQVYSETVADMQARAPQNCTNAADCVVTFALLDLNGEVRHHLPAPVIALEVPPHHPSTRVMRHAPQVIHRNYVFLGDFTDVSVLADPVLTIGSVASSSKVEGAFDVSVTAGAVAPFVWLHTRCATPQPGVAHRTRSTGMVLWRHADPHM